MNEIITAIATGSVTSAIGIIRVSGAGCIDLVSQVFKAPSGKKLSDFDERYMAYGHIVAEDRVYDEVMTVYYLGPRSYTKEDMVEIFTHGSNVSLREILQLLISKGASLAKPGEFTKRAFLNGRIDLTQAEAVMDMIGAKTKAGFDIAINQLGGHLGQHLYAIIEELTDMMAKIEVTIDYPDEDVEMIAQSEIIQSLKNIDAQFDELLATYEMGKIMRDGLSLTIVGRPNVGKSSLLNALLRENRAIVTNIAGTTRDIIEETINVKGIPIRLIDTAGIRHTDDEIERIGVEKSKMHVNNADVVIVVLDGAENLTAEDELILRAVVGKPCIVVVNKHDLPLVLSVDEVKNYLPNAAIVFTSTIDSSGIENLESAMYDHLIGEKHTESEDVISNVRHYEAVVKAQNSLKQALSSLQNGMTLDVIDVDVGNIYSAIGEITGHTVHEDVISRIFEKFCLGK